MTKEQLKSGNYSALFRWILWTPWFTCPLSFLMVGLSLNEGSEVGLPDSEGGWFGAAYKYGSVDTTLGLFMVPGVLNLAPWAWVVSKQRRVRAAAIVAGVLGLIRLAIPPLVLMVAFDTAAGAAGGNYFRFESRPPFGAMAPYLDVWLVGSLAWVVSLMAWWVFELRTKSMAAALHATGSNPKGGYENA